MNEKEIRLKVLETQLEFETNGEKKIMIKNMIDDLKIEIRNDDIDEIFKEN